MTQKKSPRCLAAVGADQKGGKEFLASSDLATPARPAQAECCANCQFFRAVALASGHDRKLCMLSGEKLRTAAGWCDLFAAGSWEETWADPNPSPLPKWLLRSAERLRALTHTVVSGMVEAPKYNERRTASAIPVICPGAGRSTRKSIAANSAYHAAGVFIGWRVHIGQSVRPGVRETPAASRWAGERMLCPFSFYSRNNEAPMHSIPLFRAASCGGRVSLSFLLRKLARAGETAALVALLGTSLSTSARVRWAMLGNVLTVVEVNHAA